MPVLISIILTTAVFLYTVVVSVRYFFNTLLVATPVRGWIAENQLLAHGVVFGLGILSVAVAIGTLLYVRTGLLMVGNKRVMLALAVLSGVCTVILGFKIAGILIPLLKLQTPH